MDKLALALVLWISFGVVSAADGRVWTDKSGEHEIKAELVEVRDDQVVLKTDAGKQINVPLDRLCAADREYAQSKRPSGKPAASPRDSAFQVQCLGFRVRKPVPVAKKAANDMDAMMFSGSFEGTEVEFLITADRTTADTQLVSVDESSSQLGQFRDNLGNALLKAGERPMGLFSGRIRPDGHAAIVKLAVPGIPAQDATKLSVEATLVLRCSKGEKTVESDLIDLKTGGKVKVGETTVAVKEGGKGSSVPLRGFFCLPGADSQEEGTAVTLEGSGPFDRIKGVSFRGPDGSPIATKGTSSTTWAQRYRVTYSLKKKTPQVKLTIVYFAKVENTQIPVAMEVGLGF